MLRRRKIPDPASPVANAEKKTVTPEARGGILTTIREWLDALVLAYLLAMFIRLFVAELFKIPSPSMTPTLLGTSPGRQQVGFYDVNRDGKEDMILQNMSMGESFDVYHRGEERYVYAGRLDPGPHRSAWLRDAGQRQDRIVVCKFSYWFSKPKRGDIVIFKVPESIYEPGKPIYIKRAVGLPGETLSFLPVPGGVPGHEATMGRLVADGQLVESPDFFKDQLYEYGRIGGLSPDEIPPYAEYRERGYLVDLVEARVPENAIYVFGDHTVSSRDSRYWGAVELDRLRGRAIFRYWRNPAFLR
jgi:signal peptidase I